MEKTQIFRLSDRHVPTKSEHLYINSGKSGSLFFVFSGKLRDGFLSNFAILFSILLSGL